MNSDIDEPVWGVPQTRRGWSSAQTLAALGVAAVIAVLGGAAIYAATSGGANEGPGMHGFGPGRPGPRESAAALHGEFVVPDGKDGYTTVLMQTGVLTVASEGSITAKSADGFTQTYTIAPGSRAANAQLAVDDTVTVHGTLANGTATATSVDEGNDAGPGGPPPMGRPPLN